MKHNFEERKQNRIDFAQQQAVKKNHEADRLAKESTEMANCIPMGQPILVGHHSEKGDRNFRKKMGAKMSKSIEVSRKAGYYADKAEAIQSNKAIFSDDPNALEKLQTKLQVLQLRQDFMKVANACIKANNKSRFLALPGATEEKWLEITTPDFMNRTGFPHYRLSNNNQEINRLKKRIAQQQQVATKTTKETVFGQIRLVENVEANRVQIFFPGIPEKSVRMGLKHSGFHWCRSEGAWQRHLTDHAVYHAKNFVKELQSHSSTPPQ